MPNLDPVITTGDVAPSIGVHASVWPGSLDASTMADHGLFVCVDLPSLGSPCHGAAFGLTFHGRAVDVAAELRRLADRIHPAPALPEDVPLIHLIEEGVRETSCRIPLPLADYGTTWDAGDVTVNELRVTCPDCLRRLGA